MTLTLTLTSPSRPHDISAPSRRRARANALRAALCGLLAALCGACAATAPTPNPSAPSAQSGAARAPQDRHGDGALIPSGSAGADVGGAAGEKTIANRAGLAQEAAASPGAPGASAPDGATPSNPSTGATDKAETDPVDGVDGVDDVDAFLLEQGADDASLAQSPGADRDPYEKLNRFVFALNDKLDADAIEPLARAYGRAPAPLKKGVANFFDNLRDVESALSNVLRMRPSDAANDVLRVTANTIFGLGGILNVADRAGLRNNKSSFGDALADMGWRRPNYLVLPIFGPSTTRDALGFAASLALDPRLAAMPVSAYAGTWVVQGIAMREALLGLTDSISGAYLDKYSYTRDMFFLALAAKEKLDAPSSSAAPCGPACAPSSENTGSDARAGRNEAPNTDAGKGADWGPPAPLKNAANVGSASARSP